MNPEDYFPEPPEFIYKFFRPERVDVLKGLRIRFANPATFNDPFEVCPRFDTFAEQAADNAVVILHTVFGILPSQSAKFVDDYKKNKLKERVKFTSQNNQKENGESFRVLCFSETVNSPLMWGHYCDSHSGFALQFDAKHPFFRGGPFNKWRLGKVQYRQERPNVVSKADPLLGFQIFLDKNDEWSYEKEWRIVEETAPTKPYYENLPVDAIKAIYFGLRMPPQIRWEIETVLNTKNFAHIKKFEMDLDLSAYKLIPVPVSSGIQNSDAWLGDGI
jgi:hypothetical protein